MAEVVVVVHISEACHSPDHGVGLGIDPLAVRVHFLLLDLVRFEGMTSLELIVPRRACTSLIQKQGLLALGGALVFMILNLPGEKGLGVALEPACGMSHVLGLGRLGSCPIGDVVIAGLVTCQRSSLESWRKS
jgi:hypothetical protein